MVMAEHGSPQTLGETGETHAQPSIERESRSIETVVAEVKIWIVKPQPAENPRPRALS